jgi:8-oxo-dGTP pyrophosphatase MutT (NUDIX family)
MGHHTKAASWIAPGGHIEPGHTIPEETVIQEAREELGIEITKERISTPFYLSAFDVFAPNRACQRHYSIWYFIPFEKEEQFTIEEREFFATKWISLADVHTLKTNTENLEAIEVLKTL